jgi:peptidoglycan/LPS O-acetylase OafA/YrhL
VQPSPIAPAPKPTRLESLDLFRGVAILAVVGIHVSGHALKIKGMQDWMILCLEVLNRSLQFAVPSFLFMTALVFTFQYQNKPLSKPLELKTFYSRRLRTVLQPYVLWTLFYGVFSAATSSLTLYNLLEWKRWWTWLWTGKAYYHLYFMILVIQFYVIFPLLLPLFRPPRAENGTQLQIKGAAIGTVQLVFYWLNRLFWQLPAIASKIFWHTFPLGLGMMVGANLERFPKFWQRFKWFLVGVLAVCWLGYLPFALPADRGQPVNTFLAALTAWLFAGSFALVLLGVCSQWEQKFSELKPRFYRQLLMFGTFSLQIYLIHPVIIKLLELLGKHGFPFFQRLSSHIVIYLLCVMVPLVFAYMVKNTRLSSVLFGR